MISAIFPSISQIFLQLLNVKLLAHINVKMATKTFIQHFSFCAIPLFSSKTKTYPNSQSLPHSCISFMPVFFLTFYGYPQNEDNVNLFHAILTNFAGTRKMVSLFKHISILVKCAAHCHCRTQSHSEGNKIKWKLYATIKCYALLFCATHYTFRDMKSVFFFGFISYFVLTVCLDKFIIKKKCPC